MASIEIKHDVVVMRDHVTFHVNSDDYIKQHIRTYFCDHLPLDFCDGHVASHASHPTVILACSRQTSVSTTCICMQITEHKNTD